MNLNKLRWGNRPWDFSRSITKSWELKAPSNDCGGMYVCKNRSYDSTQLDCQECMDDYDSAMEEFLII